MSTISVLQNISSNSSRSVSSQLTQRSGVTRMKTFAEWLKGKRTSLDISQDVVAERSAFKKAYISKLEGDKTGSIPPLATIKAIAEALGTTIEEPLAEMGFLKTESAKGVKARFDASRFARLYLKHQKISTGRRKEFERILEMVERDYDRELLKNDD